jgi:hypothetical protein
MTNGAKCKTYQQFPLNYKPLKDKFFVEKPILMRDRKGEESGSDLPLHSGVLALPEFRIRTRKQFPHSGNCWLFVFDYGKNSPSKY